MVAANFKPIDLETRVLSKLLSLSSHSNKEIVGLVEPIIRFVKTHNGNSAKLDQVNINTKSTYLTIHDTHIEYFQRHH